MADKYKALLLAWCDSLLSAQITDEKSEFFGGFRCESCSFPHGRADNAIYPLVYCYLLTDEKRYLTAVERLLVFREKLTLPSGAVQNDFSSPWQGITAFSAIGLLKTLLYFGEKIPHDLKTKIERAAIASAEWVHETLVIGFPAYINYYAASSLANALYAEYTGKEAPRLRAKELLDYCLGLFTENGLLMGEGKPHDDKSPNGCYPIDVGYIAEESMPCLIHAATLLGDENALRALTSHAEKQLAFLLSDGGWDNSFGVRNNKWTYYGSRTSDGCIGAFCALSKRDPRFAEAAERTFLLLKSCTHGGILYGGMHYHQNGEPPCIHHTFCHACALTDAILDGIKEPSQRMALPCDEEGVGYVFYPEINTYKIHAGIYSATLTGYDYATHHFNNGAAHASGGTLSLLFKKGTGVMIAGSVFEYKQTEPNNMQRPMGKKRHSTLLVRAEHTMGGVTYATCLDKNPSLSVTKEGNAVLACVKAQLCSTDGKLEQDRSVEFRYRFTPEGVTITAQKAGGDLRFILPLAEGSGKLATDSPFTKEPIFFLPGGFSAEEYAFSLDREVTVTIE